MALIYKIGKFYVDYDSDARFVPHCDTNDVKL